MTTTKRRRTIEIYFVLYLAALIFILPGPKDEDPGHYDGKGTLNIPLPFTLLPEKTTLTCRLVMDSTGPRILSLDSANTIFYTGEVEDVKFEFIIEDQSLRQSLHLKAEEKPITKYFRIEEHADRQAASFFWIPPLYERQSKNYLVRVIATARPKPNSLFSPAERESFESQTFKVRTQFSLNMIFINDNNNMPFASAQGIEPFIPQEARNLLENPPFQSMMNANPRGNFSLIVERGEFKYKAYQKWTTVLMASNINLKTDLAKNPEIKYSLLPDNNNHGEAIISDVKEDRIIVVGKTPSYGKMKVNVKVVRKYDNKEFDTDFSVSPQMFFQPTLPSRMYPEITYVMDPSLPLTDADTKAYLKEKATGEIRGRSEQGEKFSFVPSISDTGKEFVFERYVDNNLLDDHRLRVYSYDNPQVKDIQFQGNGRARVITLSYGTFNRNKNTVEKLEISGNAKFKSENFGNFDSNRNDNTQIQYFEVVVDDPNKPFNFSITAVDRRGRKSTMKPFRQP